MTTWFRRWCRNIRLVGLVLLGLLSVTSLCAPAASAQETLEDRYKRAIELFHAAKMEDACELFQQIEKEHPGYKDINSYLNPVCDTAKQTYALEEKLFKEGVALLEQQQFDEAKQKFTYGSSLPLKHPKYRTQMEEYIKQIAARSREEAHEETIWNQAVDLFAKSDLSGARVLFEEIVGMKGKHAGQAESYLGRIRATESDQRTFDEAVKAFNEKRYPEAGAAFQQVIQKGSTHAAEARSYLLRIDAARKEDAVLREEARKVAASGQDPKQVAQQLVTEARSEIASKQYVAAAEKLKVAENLDPANREARSLLGQAQELVDEQPLRRGLEAYFQGKYDDAVRHLSEYVDGHGRKLALAYFFRGAVYASRYFLSGQKDTQQKDLAFADFRALPKDAQNFQAPKDFVSHKILDLYSQAVKASSQ